MAPRRSKAVRRQQCHEHPPSPQSTTARTQAESESDFEVESPSQSNITQRRRRRPKRKPSSSWTDGIDKTLIDPSLAGAWHRRADAELQAQIAASIEHANDTGSDSAGFGSGQSSAHIIDGHESSRDSSTTTNSSSSSSSDDKGVLQSETTSNIPRRLIIGLICAITAIILGLFAVPPILLRVAVGLYGPIPVPVISPLTNAAAHLCDLTILTRDDQSVWDDQYESRNSPQDLPQSALRYLNHDGAANVDLCNAVRIRWQRVWQQERRREDGPCYKAGLGRLAQREQPKFYHPEADRSEPGQHGEQEDEADNDDDDDDSFRSNVSVSITCTRKMEQYAIPGLDIVEMRQLNQACKHWTDRSVKQARAQVERIQDAAEASRHDLLIGPLGELYERTLNVDGDEDDETLTLLSRPERAAAVRHALSCTLGSLNTMADHWLFDGTAIYYDEPRTAADDKVNKERQRSKPYKRKNHQAFWRTERLWSRYRVGSLQRVHEAVANATRANMLWIEAEPALAASVARIRQVCPMTSKSKLWRNVCELADKTKPTEEPDGRRGSGRGGRRRPRGDTKEEIPGTAHWKMVQAASDRLAEDMESLEALRCGLALAFVLFGKSGWDTEVVLKDDPPAAKTTTKYAESEFGRLVMASSDGERLGGGDSWPGWLTRITKTREAIREDGKRDWQHCSVKTMWQHLHVASMTMTMTMTPDNQHHNELHGIHTSVTASPSPPLLWRIIWMWLQALTSVRRVMAQHCTYCRREWLWPLSSWVWPSLDEAIHVLPGDLNALNQMAYKAANDLNFCRSMELESTGSL